MATVDLNCDMGESFGAWSSGADEEIIALVSSANIACGFHAGDPGVMRRTVDLALEYGVAIGAHPGFPDLAGFGRRKLEMSPVEVHDMVVYQVGALAAFAAARGATLHHVKPHGALYTMAAGDERLASAIASAVRDVDPGLLLYALAGSAMVDVAREAGLTVAEEVFADRGYTARATLVPRGEQGAVIEDSRDAARQALRMVRDGTVATIDGGEARVHADTICIHGDTPGAAEHARQLRAALLDSGVEVSAPARGERHVGGAR